MSDWTQQGITTSGREPWSNEPGAVETPDILAYVTATDDGCFEQPSTVADALERSHQDPA